MQQVETSKMVITVINTLILLGVPVMLGWHLSKVRKFEHLSFDWWMQIIIIILYVSVINCEIPALWSRFMAFYVYHINLPDSLYVLVTWDRWGHLLVYLIMYLLTWGFTKKSIPSIVKSTLN